jgi:type IV pilus assembly protein PilZ
MNEPGKPAAPAIARPGVLSLNIKDKSALYAAYMPYIKGGGIFIPSTKPYKLGDEVFILLTLMDNQEKIPVAGQVIWVTPVAAQGGRAAGIGIQFSEKDSGTARTRIESILAGHLKSERQTHTM